MCEITAGFEKICDSAGGVSRAYWWNTSDVDTLTVVAGNVTALTLNSGKYAYPIDFEIETSTYTDTGTGERANSSKAREQSATILLAGNTAAMIAQIDAATGGRVTVAFQLNDGTYEVLFLENGAKVSDVRTPGTAFEDMNGNTLTFTGKEKTKAPKVSGSIISAMLEPES